MQQWYDGYHFGDMDIYCPWDVLNYVNKAITQGAIKSEKLDVGDKLKGQEIALRIPNAGVMDIFRKFLPCICNRACFQRRVYRRIQL